MSDITLKQAIQCMESLCGTLNDHDNECLRILIDSLEEARKDQERYQFVRDMTPEDFGNMSTINEEFDSLVDEIIRIEKDHIPNVGEMVQTQSQQTESKLDCVKVTTGDHDKFHELLEAILNAGERVAMPVSFLSIINEAGMKFIKLLPPAPEGDKP